MAGERYFIRVIELGSYRITIPSGKEFDTNLQVAALRVSREMSWSPMSLYSFFPSIEENKSFDRFCGALKEFEIAHTGYMGFQTAIRRLETAHREFKAAKNPNLAIVQAVDEAYANLPNEFHNV